MGLLLGNLRKLIGDVVAPGEPGAPTGSPFRDDLADGGPVGDPRRHRPVPRVHASSGRWWR